MAKNEHVKCVLEGGAALEQLRERLKNQLADLRNADLPGIDLSGRTLDGIDFSNANLEAAKFSDSRIWSVFQGANLREARFDGSFIGSRFDDANLDRATFMHATLHGSLDRAQFGAMLVHAKLVNVSLKDTDFAHANVASTAWLDLDLRAARNLENIQHIASSSIGLDTVVKSRGQIPETFLRGCGVPEEVVSYIRSLGRSHNPIELYSCFISHSSKDEDFCQRLHNDLQAAGVRCWFAPEDLKIGDRFRDEIESALRIHDKLLLVLSENSVESDWVRSEVEGAFERESRERKRVLFPVRLDDAVIDTPKAWAADIRRQRHIGNFSHWNDPGSYKRAFDRLLRDLRATPTS